jgi:membrane protein implicated in regulation of membrane protease activity
MPSEDKDDVFIENLNMVLFLALGVLALAASLILFGYSTILAVYSQQLLTTVPSTFAFAAVLLVIGLASVQLFRKRRETRKKAQAFLQRNPRETF